MSDIPLFDIYQGTANAFRAKKDIKESEGLIAGFEAKEQEALGRRKYGVGDAWNQYLAASRQDKAADLQRQAAAQQEATAIGALKAGGAKALLGGLGATQVQAAQQRAGIEAGAQQRQQSALAQFAGVQQGSMDANVRLAAQDVKRAQTQFDLETQRKRDLIQQKREGVDQAVGGGMDAAQNYYAKYGGNMFSLGGKNSLRGIRREFKTGPITEREGQPTTENRANIRANYRGAEKRLRLAQNRADQRDAIRARKSEIAPEVMKNRSALGKALLDAVLTPAKSSRSTSQPSYPSYIPQDQRDEFDTYLASLQDFGDESRDDWYTVFAALYNEGLSDQDILEKLENRGVTQETLASYAEAKNNKTKKYGGKYASGGVQKTPGEFSHAKNPIDIMKDGAKIGEMTGGEYIFNPRQASTLQSLASKGGSPLHKYVRNLLKEFDKR